MSKQLQKEPINQRLVKETINNALEMRIKLYDLSLNTEFSRKFKDNFIMQELGMHINLGHIDDEEATKIHTELMENL